METCGPEPAAGNGASSDFFWCTHCQRTFARNAFRLVDSRKMCHYEDCDADATIDVWDWANVRRFHSEYPEEPEAGKRYLMYTVAGPEDERTEAEV